MRRLFFFVALVVFLSAAALPLGAQEDIEIIITPEATEPPASTALEFLAADPEDRFTVLVAGIESAGLVDAVDADTAMTVFAPTNVAFATSLDFLGVSQQDLLGNPELLRTILQYHVIPDEAMLAEQLLETETLTTLQGEALVVEQEGESLQVNGAAVVEPDHTVGSAVVHVIDRLLLPPSLRAEIAPATVDPDIAGVPVTANAARVRFAHLSPDTGPLDVFIDREETASASLDYGEVGDWLTVAAGTHVVTMSAAEEASVMEILGPADFAFNPGSWTTIAVVGSFEDDTLVGQPVLEDYTAIADGDARVTFFYGIEGAPPVDIVVNGDVRVGRLGYPGSIGNNDGAFVLDLPGGENDILLVFSGTGTDQTPPNSVILLDRTAMPLEPNTHYFFGVTGTTADPDAVVASDEHAVVEALDGPGGS